MASTEQVDSVVLSGVAPNGSLAGDSGNKENVNKIETVEDDYYEYELPKASINRCLKSAIPGRQSHKDFKTALGRSSTVFVTYLTAAAGQVAKERGVKSLTAAHVEEALRRIGFPDWVEEIEERMDRHERAAKKSKKNGAIDGLNNEEAGDQGLMEDESDHREANGQEDSEQEENDSDREGETSSLEEIEVEDDNLNVDSESEELEIEETQPN